MNNTFSYYVTNYFKDYLPKVKSYSSNTIKSYKETVIQLINYFENNKIDYSNIDNIDYDVINNFLLYLENENNLSISSRNQRLSAIHSLFKYIQKRELSYFDKCSQILSIEYKKTPLTIVSYLSIDEIKSLLSIPNIKDDNEFRHLIILTLLYETGARVSELINVKLIDINFNNTPYIILHGKGNKTRSVPISKDVSNMLKIYLNRFNIKDQNDYILKNKLNKKITRDGVQYIIDTYIKRAKEKYPNYYTQKITNHSFRHSKAMHLLESGVNLIYIRDILGHKSIATTEIYAKTNPEIKRKAIEDNSQTIKVNNKYSTKNKNNLLEWLKNYVE